VILGLEYCRQDAYSQIDSFFEFINETFAMDLRDLHYFEVIAELQHMGRASERLHRTQPALTSSVRRLEEACGVRLFEKSGRGIRLTEAGEVLLRWARRTRLDVHDAQREIDAIAHGLVGTVRIGVIPTAAQFLLPPAVRQLVKEAPEVTLRTVVGLTDVLKPLLHAGEIDMTIGTEGVAEPGFISEFLAEDPIVVVASATHPVFQGNPTMKDLSNYRWVLQPQGAATRDWLDQTFERQHLPRPQVQVESTMLLMLPMLIVETGLLSFIARHYLQAGRSDFTLKEVNVEGTVMRRRMVVTYRESGYLSPASRRLIDLLAAASALDK
jgi:DNA-binding transcriptional LysR family regulator